MEESYAAQIYDAAIKNGYDKCGIIPLSDMDGYEERVKERVERVPESTMFYQSQLKYSETIKEKFPWAKSIVICARWYGKYRLPESLKGHYGKYYLADGRIDQNSQEWQDRQKFESDLKAMGLEIAVANVGMRYAAMQAGLGRVRRNNFFYTERGSYVTLEAYLIDKEAVLKHEMSVPECKEPCGLCQKACKTHSLSADYTMSPPRCVSFISSFGRGMLPEGLEEDILGDWVYGCDDCQDACPFNKGAWSEENEFPNLFDLEPILRPENLAEADDKTLEEKVQPKLFYIPKERIDQFRENAKRVLRHMAKES